MDFFELLEVIGLAVLFFYLGKIYSTHNSKNARAGYGQINQDDEENELPLVTKPKPTTTPTPKKNSSDVDSKQIDKLMRDLEELKSREKKQLAQIQLLKSRLDNATNTEKLSPKVAKTDSDQNKNDDHDLLNQELESMIKDKTFDHNEPLDEEELSREIEREMQSKFV
mmetsp:Transcript_23587/g.27313  ORF Transcript_23587/g.27313 Transcript_23587/m.27313 type:complete len:168 (+) Transcript_23587:32-535(+)